MNTVRIGIIGSQFIASIHADSIKRHVRGAEIVAAASPTPSHIDAFVKKFDIPNAFTDYRKLLDMKELDLILVGAPNHLHCRMVCDAAEAGKHVIVEKPFCLNLAEADEMIAACKSNQVQLMYAEELCFAPKYVRMKELLNEGALGDVILVKQSEKHDGPHAPHFWNVEQSGGGVMMDMGCHAIEFFRWIVGRDVKVKSVYADMGTYVHHEKTKGDDNILFILKFENGVTALAEESWVKKGGMDDRAEIHGTKGIAYANLLQGNAILTYSECGYGYAVEKAASSQGWTFTIYEEAWNYGFPQELQHFVDCVRNDTPPQITGEDGRSVLEIIFAAYASAAAGQAIALPYFSNDARPIDSWLKREK
ncbi:MAG: gfo/Idh/MocA family oxidoreductase [Candidatus Omnitrophota bacterium]|jgi:predicted dehydrogenase|nr:MAG: gfo/Idh/MocA family oxidoreductase [Candidatus Omnitrophota bacterium]